MPYPYTPFDTSMTTGLSGQQTWHIGMQCLNCIHPARAKEIYNHHADAVEVEFLQLFPDGVHCVQNIYSTSLADPTKKGLSVTTDPKEEKKRAKEELRRRKNASKREATQRVKEEELARREEVSRDMVAAHNESLPQSTGVVGTDTIAPHSSPLVQVDPQTQPVQPIVPASIDTTTAALPVRDSIQQRVQRYHELRLLEQKEKDEELAKERARRQATAEAPTSWEKVERERQAIVEELQRPKGKPPVKEAAGEEQSSKEAPAHEVQAQRQNSTDSYPVLDPVGGQTAARKDTPLREVEPPQVQQQPTTQPIQIERPDTERVAREMAIEWLRRDGAPDQVRRESDQEQVRREEAVENARQDQARQEQARLEQSKREQELEKARRERQEQVKRAHAQDLGRREQEARDQLVREQALEQTRREQERIRRELAEEQMRRAQAQEQVRRTAEQHRLEQERAAKEAAELREQLAKEQLAREQAEQQSQRAQFAQNRQSMSEYSHTESLFQNLPGPPPLPVNSLLAPTSDTLFAQRGMPAGQQSTQLVNPGIVMELQNAMITVQSQIIATQSKLYALQNELNGPDRSITKHVQHNLLADQLQSMVNMYNKIQVQLSHLQPRQAPQSSYQPQQPFRQQQPFATQQPLHSMQSSWPQAPSHNSASGQAAGSPQNQQPPPQFAQPFFEAATRNSSLAQEAGASRELEDQQARQQAIAQQVELAKLKANNERVAREREMAQEQARQRAEQAKREQAQEQLRREKAQEQARQEQARQEQARQEQARQEQVRQEQARQEQARQEQARQEQARQEQARQEQARQEQARREQAQEQARQEQARRDKAQEQARQEQARREAQEKARREQAQEQAKREQALEQARRDRLLEQARREHQAREQQAREQTKREQALQLARREQAIREKAEEQTRREQERVRRELAAEQAQRGQTQEQTRRASGPQGPPQQPYQHRNLTELHPSPPHGLSQPLQSQPSIQLYPPPVLGPQTQPPSQLQNQQRNQSQHDDVPLHLSSLQSRALQQEGHQQSPTDRDTPPIPLPQPAASQPQQSGPVTKESEQQTTANQQAQERPQSTMHSTSQSANSKMQDYLDLQSVTAQAQLAAAQRNQWMQLAQMARPPIGMNGLSTAFTMAAMQPNHVANSRHAGLKMHGLESGREAVQFPMPQHFDSYSPSPMAPSPFYMSDAHEIVPLPVEAPEETAGRFTEINESPNEKGASQLPTQSSPSRQHAEKAALQAGSSGALRNGANCVATPQVAVAKMGEPFMAHATSIESVKPVASNPAIGVDSSVSAPANRGPSNGQPQIVRVGRPEVSPRPPPIAITVDESQKLVDAAPTQVDSARESTIPSAAAVTPETQNSAKESSIPMTDAQTRIRQRSDSEDEQAAGERPTKRRRTDQSRCIPPRPDTPSSPRPRAIPQTGSSNGNSVSQEGKPSWKCASDTSDTETVAAQSTSNVVRETSASTESVRPAVEAAQPITAGPSAASATNIPVPASQASKASSVRQTLEKVFDKNPHPSDAVFAKLALALKIEDVEPVKRLFALWRQNGHKPSSNAGT